MAFVHPQSCECTKSELDLFSVPPTQTSIETGSYVEYNPIATISQGTPIEFSITGAGQDYLDLSNTQLYVRAAIVRANNDPTDAGDHVGPINLFLHSLFSEVDITLNDTLVTSSNNTYAYRSYLETILSYGDAAKASQLTSALFYKDTAPHMEDANPHDDNLLNVGFKKRSALTDEGRVVDMIGGIHSDLFFQERFLPNDINIKIRLVRNKDPFCLMSATQGAAYKVKILECKLYVRKVKLSPSVFLAHAKALEVGNLKFPIRRAICKTFTVPAGNLDASQESLFSGQIPTRIVIGCVDNDAFNGVYTKNPFNFKHMNLTQLKVYLDGQQQSIKPLETNFAVNQFVNAYASLFTGTGKWMRDEGNQITREDFAGGYTLYAFDLTPDLAEGGHFNLIKPGNIRVDMKFGQALARTINVIAFAEFENILEIDRSRNVIFDYTN
jgi:hypothetical protein